jgi:hypothetical protein
MARYLICSYKAINDLSYTAAVKLLSIIYLLYTMEHNTLFSNDVLALINDTFAGNLVTDT